mgnify:CR=1 FL=1
MSERLKQLRKTLKLTQQEFADRIGIARGNIGAYEVGKNAPSDAVISLICREFNVNEKWLRSGEGEMFVIPDDEDAVLVSDLLENTDDVFYQSVLELIRTYKQLQPESQQVLRNVLQQFAENIKNRKD